MGEEAVPGVTGMKETENNADEEIKTIKRLLILSLVVAIIAVALGGAVLVLNNHCSGYTREELMMNAGKCLPHLGNDKITVIKVRNVTLLKVADDSLLVISGEVLQGYPINIMDYSVLVSSNIVLPVTVMKSDTSGIVLVANENDIVITGNTYLENIKSNLEGRRASIISFSELEECMCGEINMLMMAFSVSVVLFVIIVLLVSFLVLRLE